MAYRSLWGSVRARRALTRRLILVVVLNPRRSQAWRQVRNQRVIPRRALSGPLARVTRGQPRSPGITRFARSAPLTAVAAALPKLIVRVRFPSPAPDTLARQHNP